MVRSSPRAATRLLLAAVAAMAVLPVAACSPGATDAGDGAGPTGVTQSPPAAAPTWDPAGMSGPKITSGKVMLGSFLSLRGKSYREALALRRKQLGRDQRIVHWFYAWKDALPARPDIPGDGILLISWRGTGYESITSGSQDEWIAKQARTVAAYKAPVFLRWGWEMNGDWYAWSGVKNGNDPAGYVAAWRHIHDIFQREGADNVGWVWNPNVNSHPTEPWNNYDNYYPGDDYVDWVGISGYGTRTRGPEDIFGEIYRRYNARKPLMITETGVADAGGVIKADWIAELATYLKQHPAFAALVWFDTDTHAEDQDWRIDTSASALQAYKKLARDPYFAG